MRWVVVLCMMWAVGCAKVYDCFLFFNEWEVLELRLHELYDHVDTFVIVESCEGFRGHEKRYNFEDQRERYAPFLDKIVYVKLSEQMVTDNPWHREWWQRNQIMRGLEGCKEEDVIFISDVDEFIPGEMVEAVVAARLCIRSWGFGKRCIGGFSIAKMRWCGRGLQR